MLKSKLTPVLASASAIVGLVATALPPASAIDLSVISRGEYERCAATLLGLQISAPEASAACSRAFKPLDLSTCVSQVSQGGPITAVDALGACRQVRRPVEMASCVVDIRRTLTGAIAADVMESCRRSLLPVQYSNCVLGLSQSVKFTPPEALNTCIVATDFPRDIDPTFIPYPLTPAQAIPSTVPQLTPFTPTEPIAPLTPAPAPSPTPIPQLGKL